MTQSEAIVAVGATHLSLGPMLGGRFVRTLRCKNLPDKVVDLVLLFHVPESEAPLDAWEVREVRGSDGFMPLEKAD